MDGKNRLGLNPPEWAGLVVVVVTTAGILWILSDADMAIRVGSTLFGALLGLVASVIFIRLLK
jgi:hypothetical protein